jgi:integrase
MIFSMEEVTRLLASANNFKHQVLLKTIYSAGLRVSEVVRLKPHHIESDPSRMMIRVEQGKGKKDRYTILSKKLLVNLRDYWGCYQPGTWLFPGNKTEMHMCTNAAQMAFYLAKKKPA